MMSESKSCLVIGSGMGGLAVAALLTKAGYGVTVLEAHPTLIGGYAQTLGNSKYKFAAGPRYLWNFGPGEPGYQFLEKCELLDKVPMVQLDRSGFDRIYLDDDDPIAVPNGWESYGETLKQRFPNDASGIDKFFRLCRRTFKLFEFAEERSLNLAPWFEILARYAVSGRMSATAYFGLPYRARWTLQRAFDSCGIPPKLQSILYGHGMILALPKEEVSFYAYVASTLFYHRGCYYPKHDMSGFVNALVESITAGGGSVQTGCRIAKVTTEAGRITSVTSDDNRQFTAETYVSNIDPKQFAALLEPGSAMSRPFPDYQNSLSLTSIYLGINDSSVLKSHFGPWNIWYTADLADQRGLYDRDPQRVPQSLYLNSPSWVMGDRSSNHATVTGFVPSSYRVFAEMKRSSEADYQRVVKRHREEILDLIEKRFIPNLRDVLEYCEIRTPMDNEEILLARHGNVYGRRLTPAGSMQNIPWKGQLANLYSVGSVVGFAGIVSVIQNACLIYREMTGDQVG